MPASFEDVVEDEGTRGGEDDVDPFQPRWTYPDPTFDQQFADLAAAPVSALQGVSESDAEHLKAAFGIDTIRELATNKFVLWAQAINVLAK